MSLMARIAVHKSKRVGGLDYGAKRVIVTALLVWLHSAVGRGWEHKLDSSMFVTNGQCTDWFGTVLQKSSQVLVEGRWLYSGQMEWRAGGQVAQLWESVEEKASQRVVQDLRRPGITAAITYKNPQQNSPPLLNLNLVSGYLLFNTVYRATHLFRGLFLFYLSCI